MFILTKPDTIKRTQATERNQRIYSFLQSQPIGVLATVDPNNDPHAAVIYFSVDDDFNILFVTKRDTKKSDNIEHNSHVMMVVYEAASQTTAQITGIAKQVTDTDIVAEALAGNVAAASQTSESGQSPLDKLRAGSHVAYCIQPASIKMAMFIRPDPGGQDMYETADLN